MNIYFGPQGTVNEDKIALNLGHEVVRVIDYDLFDLASCFRFQSTGRQWYHFSLRSLILDSFSLLNGSCIQDYAPLIKFWGITLDRSWNGLMVKVLMSMYVILA
jgi:hypothetical protein